MKRGNSTAVTLAALTMLLLTAPGGAAQASTCRNTAHLMERSCFFEAAEEYYEALAICENHAEYLDRRGCDVAAWYEREDQKKQCGDAMDARVDTCELLDEDRYADPLLDPSIEFVDPDDIGEDAEPNPYIPLVVGRTWVLRAGEDFEELLVITVTDEKLELQDVDCRVVVDAELVIELEDGETEYELDEVTDDWYAQSAAGDVYYCGELSRSFEDGLLDNLDGSFAAGREDAKAGVLIRANPTAGEAHRQEYALGEAEDVVQYLDLATEPGDAEGGDNPAYPCNGACLKTLDFAPPEPESTERKYYLPDIGFVLATKFEDGELEDEREELVCWGDSLDVLDDEACGIEDPEAVRELLCETSPDAFCADDEEDDDDEE